MNPAHRATPLTALDALRALLGSYSDADKDFEARLFDRLQGLRQQAIGELGDRLQRSTTPRGLKRTILKVALRLDWPEWAPVFLAFLQVEQDLGLFDDGCTALGNLCTRESAAALGHLSASRTDQERQLILHRELSQGAAQQDPGYYFARLLEGKANPKLSRHGLRVIAAQPDPPDLAQLVDAHRRGDELVRLFALRLLAELPGEGPGAYLIEYLAALRGEFEQVCHLDRLLQKTRTLPRGQVREELLRELELRMGSRLPDPIAALQREAKIELSQPAPILDQLRRSADGPLDTYLLDALGCLLEGKVARYGALHSESAETAERRQVELAAAADECAAALARRVLRGLSPDRARAVASLSECFTSRCGGDDTLMSLVRIASPEDPAALDLFLGEEDLRRRTRCLDLLGAREDDAFAPFFLKATEDPIVEVGQVAMHHLGKLPSGFQRVMTMFRSGQPDQVRRAIRVFGENRTRAAAEALLDALQEEARDEIVLEAVISLGAIVYPAAAKTLLELLHDGKPLNLQSALAEALGRMAVPEACLGLLDRAAHLKIPQVLVLALEGSLTAFPSFSKPFPAERVRDFEALLLRCCDDREGEGRRVRAMFAAQGLYAFDRDIYDRMKDRFSDYLSEMRTAPTWDRELNDRVAAVIKELGRRGVNLSRLEERESALLTMLQKLPSSGNPRMEALLQLRDGLKDPELVLRPDAIDALARFVQEELDKPGKEWRELAHLCEIGGLTAHAELAPTIREVYRRATGIGLRAAARESLLRLGLSEAEIDRRSPVQSVLVIEPSAFFRKRLVAAIAERGYQVQTAGDRLEAAGILAQAPVDLLVTESTDLAGEMAAWLEEQWKQRRCREILLATSSRDLGPVLESPWLLGALYKPFPLEHLLQAIES
jgi:HEAT repeat protein